MDKSKKITNEHRLCKKIRKTVHRKLASEKGAGEYISFAVIMTVIATLIIFSAAFAQLSRSLDQINNALSAVSRTVAVASDYDSAAEYAQKIAETALVQTNSISNVKATVTYLDTSTEEGTWKSGTQLLVTLSAKIKTWSPFTSGKRERSTIVCVEKIEKALKAGALADTVRLDGGSIDGLYTSYFGDRSWDSSLPSGASSYHRGVDLGLGQGTALAAPADCIVVYKDDNHASRGGWLVMYVGGGYYVEYEHMSKIAVNVGDTLSEGTYVGNSGGTPGTYGCGTSSGAHLHLGVLYSTTGENDILYFDNNENRIDPSYFISGYNVSDPSKPASTTTGTQTGQ